VTRDLHLDGTWELAPDGRPDAAVPIEVPGLWEAQGLLELDGVATYRRRFRVDDAGGCWTLRFGAVMDTAEVTLNGVPVGGNDLAFTSFELDVTAALSEGENELVVKVTDRPSTSPAPTASRAGPTTSSPARPVST